MSYLQRCGKHELVVCWEPRVSACLVGQACPFGQERSDDKSISKLVYVFITEIANSTAMAIHLENGHTDSVLSADCCKDSCGHIVTGSEGGQLCLWNEDGTLLGILPV